MTREEVLITVKKLIEEVLDDGVLDITEATTASEVEEWDSIMHIEIIVEIEEHYGVKFQTSQIENFKNVGSMVSAVIEAKL